MHGAHLPNVHGMEADATELQMIVEARHVGEATPQPVQRFADDDVELACLGINKHLPVGWSVDAGTAQRAIIIAADERPILAIDVAPTDLDLILDRGFTLIVRRVSGVDDGTHG
ncbi:MAG: hypothetical protein R3D01_01405 [Hyphomicrobiales bacterium]